MGPSWVPYLSPCTFHQCLTLFRNTLWSIKALITTPSYSFLDILHNARIWYLSGYLTQIPNMIKITQDCISDLKSWLTLTNSWNHAYYHHHHPKQTKPLSHHPLLPQSMSVNNATRQLYFICPWLWCHSWQYSEHHISSICTVTYLKLRRISSICHYLSIDATKILICSFVLRVSTIVTLLSLDFQILSLTNFKEFKMTQPISFFRLQDMTMFLPF